jgi:hypothetical protein
MKSDAIRLPTTSLIAPVEVPPFIVTLYVLPYASGADGVRVTFLLMASKMIELLTIELFAVFTNEIDWPLMVAGSTASLNVAMTFESMGASSVLATGSFETTTGPVISGDKQGVNTTSAKKLELV